MSAEDPIPPYPYESNELRIALEAGYGGELYEVVEEQTGIDISSVDASSDEQKLSKIKLLGQSFEKAKAKYIKTRRSDDYESLINARKKLFTYIEISDFAKDDNVWRKYVLKNLPSKSKMPNYTKTIEKGISKLNEKLKNGKMLYKQCNSYSVSWEKTKIACQKYQREIKAYQKKIRDELISENDKPHSLFSQVVHLFNKQKIPISEFEKAKSLEIFAQELKNILRKKDCNLICINKHLKLASSNITGEVLQVKDKNGFQKLIKATEKAETFFVTGAASATSFRGCMLKVAKKYEKKFPYNIYQRRSTGDSERDHKYLIDSMFLTQLTTGKLPHGVNSCGSRSYVYNDEVDPPAKGVFSNQNSLNDQLEARENNSVLHESETSLPKLQERFISVSEQTWKVRSDWIKRIQRSRNPADARLKRQMLLIDQENIPRYLKNLRKERIAIKHCSSEKCKYWSDRINSADQEYFFSSSNEPVLKRSRHQMVLMHDEEPKGFHNTRSLAIKGVGSPIQSDILRCNQKRHEKRIKCLNSLQEKYNARQKKLKEKVEGQLSGLAQAFVGEASDKNYENEQSSFVKASLFKDGLTDVIEKCKTRNESWTNTGPINAFIKLCKKDFKSFLTHWGLEKNSYFKDLMSDWKVEKFNKMFRDITAVEEYFGSGTISQYINRNCQYQYLKKNKPEALKGITPGTIMDPSQTLSLTTTLGEPINYLIGNEKINGLVPVEGENPNYCEPPTYLMSTKPPTEEVRALVDKSPKEYKDYLNSIERPSSGQISESLPLDDEHRENARRNLFSMVGNTCFTDRIEKIFDLNPCVGSPSKVCAGGGPAGATNCTCDEQGMLDKISVKEKSERIKQHKDEYSMVGKDLRGALEGEELYSCEYQFKNREYKQCEYDASKLDFNSCDVCRSMRLHLPTPFVRTLTGHDGMLTRIRLVGTDPNDPTKVSTYHYEKLLKSIAIKNAVATSCKAYGESLGKEDWPASCDGSIYDAYKSGKCSGAKFNQKEVVDANLKVAGDLSKLISDINKLENDEEYQDDIDELVEDLKKDDKCSNISNPSEDILTSTVRFFNWAKDTGVIQTSSCMMGYVKSVPSRVKNFLIENDYRRYARTGDEAYLDKYVEGIGVMISGTWSDKDKKKLKQNIVTRVDRSLGRVAKSRGRYKGVENVNVIKEKREKILNLRKKIMAKASIAPILFADLANENRASAFSDDPYHKFPKLSELKVLKRFREASKGGSHKYALGLEAYESGLSVVKDSQIDYLDKICTANIKDLIQDDNARNEAERVFPNLKTMSQCILHKSDVNQKLISSLKNFTVGSLVIGGGIAACALTEGVACAAITAGLGLGVGASELSSNTSKREDAIACNISGGDLDPRCKGVLLSQLRDERDVIVAGMLAEVPLALVDLVPVGKILNSAVKDVKAATGLTVGKLRRIGSRAGKAVASQVKTASKSMKGLSFGQKMARMHGLIEVLQDSAQSFSNFMTRVPDGLVIPDSFLDDLARLSDSSRESIQKKMYAAVTKDEYLKVLDEVKDIRDVQNALRKELGGLKNAKLKYPCMF